MARDRLDLQGYDIVKFDGLPLENEIYRRIAINRKAILGKGSYGNVYKGYPVDPESGEIIKSKKLAVKIFRNTKHVNSNEAKFFDSYYGGSELITRENDIYTVMTCLPGKNIMDNQKRSAMLNIEISQFDFFKRVDLIYNIMMAINIIHHNTPSTGAALIHGDINGSNIKVYVDQDTGKIDVYILDFGLSKELEDSEELQDSQMDGTPLFMPNEVIEFEVQGIKSDIYALTPIFAAILGASNPFALKTKLPYYNPEYYKTPYDFTDMFANYLMPTFPFDVKSYILKFLNRMQDQIDARPDSDETLRFFTTLNKLCKIISADPKHADVYTCGAKLAILADGLWKDSQFNSEEDEAIVPRSPAPEHFDFDDPHQLTTSLEILKAAKKTPLSPPILKKIMSKGTLFSKSTDGDDDEKTARVNILLRK